MDGLTVSDNDQKDEKKGSDKDILSKARERFTASSSYFQDHHRKAREDVAFRAGDQWDENVKRERELESKPCLNSSKLQTFIRNVVNSQMANMPAIGVRPQDSKADPETAQVLQSVIRTIEASSRADMAYRTAFTQAATSGLGFFRLVTDFVSPMSMDQDIKIKPILNEFSVLLDPYAVDPLFADAEFGFVWEDVPRDSYKQMYPDSKCLDNQGFFEGDDPDYLSWIGLDTIRVAEYFYAEHEEFTLVQLADGKTLDKKEYEILLEQAEKAMKMAMETNNLMSLMAAEQALPPVVAERKSTRRVIRWCKTNGYELLEKTDWVGQFVPIIPVFGEMYLKDGKRVFEGVIRHAKDPQRKVNYFDSMETETVALAPRAPFVGAAGQFEGYEEQWRQANRKNLPYLEYKPMSVDGQPVGPPTRQTAEPPIQAITMARMNAVEDIKQATGIFDPAMGKQINGESGIAVLAQQNQAAVSNFHYGDNLAKSVCLAGQMIVEMLPKVYDMKRTVRIVGDEEKVVAMGANIAHDPRNNSYRLGLGQYDVEMQPNKAGTTARQQSLNVLAALLQTAPEIAQSCGDIVAKNLDIPEAKEISDRIKRTIPPSILGEELPAEVQAQINQIQQQAQQQIAMLHAQGQQMQTLISQLTAKSNELQVKVDSKQMETESKERIEMLKLRKDLFVEGMKLDQKTSMALMLQGLKMIDGQLSALDMGQAPTPEPQGSPAGTETFVIPGVNDPVTQERKNAEAMAAMQAPVAPPNLRPRGPTQMGARIQQLENPPQL